MRSNIELPFETGIVHVNLFERRRLFEDGQQTFRAFVRQFQVAAAELKEEGVELEGGNDGYQISAVIEKKRKKKTVVKFSRLARDCLMSYFGSK